jgi:DNA-binding response OmpR family regulator
VIDTNRDITVLIVEDDRDVREMICHVLERKRFTCLTADGVWQAVEKLKAADILTLDLNLPNGDGRDILQQWIKLPGLRPAVVISGHMTSDEKNGLLALAWNTIRKPFDIELLADRYAYVVRGDRCCREIAKFRRVIFIQWLVIAGGLGTQYIIPLLKTWIGGL